jgi:hypothetical protein
MCTNLNIDKIHFEQSLNLVTCQESCNDENNEMFYKKIKFNIGNFDQFSNNIFYSQKPCLNSNIELDNFTKNFCNFVIDMLKQNVDCKTLDNLVELILKNPTEFYQSYLDYIFKIYSFNGFSYNKEKHVKLINFTASQRNSQNRVTISTENQNYFLHFIIPSKE